MNEAERSGLSTMRDCWITGGAAANLAPPEWQQIVAGADADERERLLLAIAGQAFDVGFRPAAPKALTMRPALPKLTLPGVPERLRSLFRVALKNAGDNRTKLGVVALVEARGYVSHPLDWIPAASDIDAPRAYAPWIDWQAEGAGKGLVLDALSVENWDDFYPAARRIALADLRRADPAAARALLEAKAAMESAEVRFALIELMRVNLSSADAPYLQSLSSDRSGKVKQLAARLLARIGQVQSEEGDEQIKELADFIEQGRTGLLRRRTVYTPKPLKNWAQIKRRQELFESCQLGELAATLGCNEFDLVQGWQLGGKDGVDASFAGMVGESGGDAAVAKLAERLLEAGDAAAFALLLPRLGRSASRAFVTMVLAKGQTATHLLSIVPDIEAGSLAANELMSSNAYRQMRAEVASRATSGHTPDFSIYGYLATADAAEKIVADLAAAGLASADPSLALLRLNTALATR